MPAAIAEPTDTPAAESLDPAAYEEKGFGDMLNEQVEQRETDRLAKEEKEPAEDKKADAKKGEEKPAAVTPVGDVLDAAIAAKEAAKKDEPPPDPLAEYQDIEKGTKSESVKENIVKMRERIGVELKKNAELSQTVTKQTKELEQAKANPELSKIVAEKEAKITELTKSIMALDVRYHPDFQKEFVVGRKELVERILEKTKAYQGDPEALQGALSMPEGKRRLQAIREALGEDVDAVAAIQPQIAKLDDLDERAAEKTKDSGKSWEALQQSRAEETAIRQAQNEKAKDAVFERLQSTLGEANPLLRKVDPSVTGATEHNAGIDKAFADARRIHSEGTLDETGPLAVKGFAYDGLEKRFIEERTQRRALETKLREYEGAEPGLRGTKKPVISSAEEDDNLGLGDLLAKKAAEREERD